jgi:hypothetical protein
MRLRQENQEFEVRLGYIARLWETQSLKRKKTQKPNTTKKE